MICSVVPGYTEYGRSRWLWNSGTICQTTWCHKPVFNGDWNCYLYWYKINGVFIHSLVFSLTGRVAGTRAQSCDRYGCGTLHPGQVLGCSLPLLSPAFRHSHFRRQVPVRPQRRERSYERKVEMWAINCPVILPKFRLPRKFMDLSHAANLRHGTDVFTSPPKEGVLRIFSP